jgi:hypothetical protein
MTSKTIQATQTEKLVSVVVEDGEVVCKGRSIIDINGKKIRGPIDEVTITKWPFVIDGVKYNRKDILDLLQAIYEAEVTDA